MPLQKIQFKPGINKEVTSLAGEGGWYDCDKVRFRGGFPEKIGGWAVLTYNTFLGVARSLWNWVTLKQFNILGVGTNLKFYVENGGTYYDITPIRATTLNTTTFAAGYTTLNGGINLSADSITLTSGTNFPEDGGLIKIGTEQIQYTSRVGAVLSGCERGVNGTTAASHLTGVAVASAMLIVTDSGSADVQVDNYVTFSNAISLSGVLTYTVNTTTNVITVSSALTNNTPVNLFTTTTMPGGLSTFVTYYVIDAAGTNCKLSLSIGGAAIDITTAGTGTQTLAIATGMTNNVLNQEYQVLAVTSTLNYIIQARAQVTSPALNIATTNGGAPVFATSTDSGNGGSATDTAYQLNTGLANYVIGTGMGTGSWARGAWGSGFTSGIGLQLRLWSQSNYGEDLIFSPRGGALYLWQPGPGTTPAYGTRGQLIGGATLPGSDVPTLVNSFAVSDATRIVICFGCNDIGTSVLDPLLVRWSAQEDYLDWTPVATNQAGSFRLSRGSVIIGALQTRQEILVWTDASLYSMQYLGPPFVWGFTLLADNLSIASPNVMVTASGNNFWMGLDKFYAYAGRVETLPCPVRRYVFGDININQTFQFFGGTNEGYSEIWWFYCTTNSEEINNYVIYNYLEQAWYVGTLGRTAWLDSGLRQYPMGATTGNTIVYHEAIVDNGETNPPSPIVSYIQSSDFDIAEGQNYSFAWRMVPDITFNGSTTPLPLKPKATFTLRPKANPGAAYGASASEGVTATRYYNVTHSYEVQEFTEIIYTRARGRQMAFKVECNTLGAQWQLGATALDLRTDGRR